jgi:hypothetical protein
VIGGGCGVVIGGGAVAVADVIGATQAVDNADPWLY